MPTSALKNKKRKLTTASLPSPQRRKTANVLTMGASSDTIMTGDDAHREAQVNLIHLPPAQRQQFYKEVFSKRVEPLTHISEPDECNEWPDLRDEILEAYLRYTTFSVKVWANVRILMGKRATRSMWLPRGVSRRPSLTFVLYPSLS
jgi:hypothetical protein